MIKSLYEAPTEDYDLPTEKDGVKHFTAKITPDVRFSMKDFVESYRCRICKKDLNLDNFGGVGENHMIFCKGCSATV